MADGPLQLLCKLGFSGTILTALPLIVSLLRRVFFIQTLNVSRLSPMRRETGLSPYCSHFMSHPSDGLPLTLSTTMSPDLVNGILRTGCKQKLYEVAPSHSGKKKYSLWSFWFKKNEEMCGAGLNSSSSLKPSPPNPAEPSTTAAHL